MDLTRHTTTKTDAIAETMQQIKRRVDLSFVRVNKARLPWLVEFSRRAIGAWETPNHKNLYLNSMFVTIFRQFKTCVY